MINKIKTMPLTTARATGRLPDTIGAAPDNVQPIHIRVPIKEWVWIKQRACDNGLHKLKPDNMNAIINEGIKLYISKYNKFKGGK